MLIVFAIILTSITIICTPVFLWLMIKQGEEFTFFGPGDEGSCATTAILGWLSSGSFLFALILWAIYGTIEYRRPVPRLNESLSSLQIVLQETETAIARLEGQARDAERSSKNYQDRSAKTVQELASLQSALAMAKRNQGEIRKILMGPQWGDRLWSFILGVLSSLIATLLWRFVCHHRQRSGTPT